MLLLTRWFYRGDSPDNTKHSLTPTSHYNRNFVCCAIIHTHTHEKEVRPVFGLGWYRQKENMLFQVDTCIYIHLL